MREVFDANCHFTRDGKYLPGYSRNMPSTFATYLEQSECCVDLCGLICTALPNMRTNSDWELLEKLLKTDASIAADLAYPLEAESFTVSNPLSASKGLLKLHEGMLGTLLSSDQLTELMQDCQQKSIVLFICTYFSSRKYPWEAEQNLKIALGRLAASDVRVPVVLAHAGGAKFLEFNEMTRHNRNIYLDTSFSLLRYRQTSVFNDFIYALQNPNHKIMFGSDWPDHSWTDLADVIEEIAERIPDENLQRFLTGNAREVFGNAL